jgi:phage-related minor tail protein
MDLSQLVFKVDTTELDAAVKKVADLGSSVKELNQVSKDTVKTSKEVSKAEREAAQAREASAKAAVAEVRAEEAKNKVKKDTTKTVKETTVAVKENTTVLERQKNILEFMTQGFSKGQAGYMATAKAAKATTAEMKELTDVLLLQRKLSGGDPFDKSNSGLVSLRNRLTEVREANRLYSAGIELTRNQTREMARDKERLIVRMKTEGATLSEIKQAIQAYNAEFIKTSSQVNRLVESEKELERVQRERVNAVRALTEAEDRADSMVRSMTNTNNANAGSSERAARSIAAYENRLKLAGVTGEQAALRLEKYRSKVSQIQALENNRKVDMLSRALAPQISDVVVSLQGGQKPITVLLQQGLQIRDLIGLSGVAVEDLQKSFKSAAANMVSSIGGTFKALGALMLGTINDAGAAVVNLGMKMTGLSTVVDFLNAKMAATSVSSSFVGKAFSVLGGILRFAVGTAIAGSLALFGSLLVAFKQVIQEENALSRALATGSQAFGMNRDQAYSMAESMNAVGVNTRKAVSAISEITKYSKLAGHNIEGIAKSAIDMEKYAGVAISDTVKKFAELAEKPTEAVIKLARETGRVPPEVIKLVAELERQGKTADAARVATEALAKANSDTVNQIQSDYGYLMKSLVAVKSFFSGLWDSILGVGRADTLGEQLKKAQEKVLQASKNVTSEMDVNTSEMQRLEAAERTVREIQKQIDAEARVSAEKVKQAALSEMESNWQTRENEGLDRKLKLETEIAKIRKEGIELGKSETEIKAQIERAKDKYKEKEKTSSKGPSQDIDKDIKRAKEVYDDLMNKIVGFNKAFNNEFQSILLLEKEGLITAEQRVDAIKELLMLQPAYREELERQSEIIKEEIQWVEEKRKLREEIREIEEESRLAYEQHLADIEFEFSLLGMTNAQREEAIRKQKEITELQRIENKLAKDRYEIEKRFAELRRQNPQNDYTEAEAAALRAAEDRADRERTIARRKAILEEKKEYQKIMDEFQSGVTDSIVTAIFEGGKAGAKKLRDVITQALRKRFTIYVDAIVNQLFGGLFGNGSGGNMMNMAAMGMEMYSSYSAAAGGGASAAMTSGSGIAAAQWAGGGMSGANAAGSVFANVTGTGIDGLLLTNGAYGTAGGAGAGAAGGAGASGWMAAAGWAALIAAAIAIANNLYDKGYNRAALGIGENKEMGFMNTTFQTNNKFGESDRYKYSHQNVNRKLGDMLGLSEKWTDILSGTTGMAALFGRKLKHYGFDVQMSGGQTQVDGYQYYKGGVFRSDKTVRMDIDSRDAEMVKQSVEQIKESAKAQAGALGLSKEAIDNYTGSLKVNFKNANTAEEQAKRFAEAMDNLYYEMIKTASGGTMTKEAFMKIREEANKLAESVGITAKGMSDIIVKGMTGELDRAAVGEQLATMVIGGIYNTLATPFADQIASVFQSQIITPIFTAIMAGVPISQAISQSAIESVVATAQNAAAALNAIFSDPSFRAAIGDIQTAISGIAGAATSVKPPKFRSSSGSKAQKKKSIADERFGLEGKLLNIVGNTTKIRERELMALNATNRALQQRIYALEDAQAAFERSMEVAENKLEEARQSEADIKAVFDTLTDAVKDFRREAESTVGMEIAEARQFIFDALTSGELPNNEKLGEAIGVLKSDFDNRKFVSKFERDREAIKLSNMLDALRESVGTDLAEKSADVILLEEQLQIAQTQLDAMNGIQENTQTTAEAVQTLQSTMNTFVELMRQEFGLSNLFAVTSGGASTTQGSGGIPQFADGGYYKGGLALVGEEGPELINFSQPGRVYNASQTSAMMTGSDQVGRDEFEMVKQAIYNIAINTGKMNRFFSRVEGEGGDSINVSIDGGLDAGTF